MYCLDGSDFSAAAGSRNWIPGPMAEVIGRESSSCLPPFVQNSSRTLHYPSTEMPLGKRFFTAFIKWFFSTLLLLFFCFRQNLEFPCFQPPKSCHWAVGIRSQRSYHPIRERMEEVEAVYNEKNQEHYPTIINLDAG